MEELTTQVPFIEGAKDCGPQEAEVGGQEAGDGRRR